MHVHAQVAQPRRRRLVERYDLDLLTAIREHPAHCQDRARHAAGPRVKRLHDLQDFQNSINESLRPGEIGEVVRQLLNSAGRHPAVEDVRFRENLVQQ